MRKRNGSNVTGSCNVTLHDWCLQYIYFMIGVYNTYAICVLHAPIMADECHFVYEPLVKIFFRPHERPLFLSMNSLFFLKIKTI